MMRYDPCVNSFKQLHNLLGNQESKLNKNDNFLRLHIRSFTITFFKLHIQYISQISENE